MIDKPRIVNAVKEILLAIGEDPSREGLIETPQRVAEMYEEIFAGMDCDPLTLAKLFNEEGSMGMVVLKDIPLYSMCEHHLMPFFGKASVAYLPGNGQVIGLSKIARIVDMVARKPQLQERLCDQVAEVIAKACGARGVLVVCEAEHLCMTMRGIKKSNTKTATYASRGLMTDDSTVRSQAMMMLKD